MVVSVLASVLTSGARWRRRCRLRPPHLPRRGLGALARPAALAPARVDRLLGGRRRRRIRHRRRNRHRRLHRSRGARRIPGAASSRAERTLILMAWQRQPARRHRTSVRRETAWPDWAPAGLHRRCRSCRVRCRAGRRARTFRARARRARDRQAKRPRIAPRRSRRARRLSSVTKTARSGMSSVGSVLVSSIPSPLTQACPRNAPFTRLQRRICRFFTSHARPHR